MRSIDYSKVSFAESDHEKEERYFEKGKMEKSFYFYSMNSPENSIADKLNDNPDFLDSSRKDVLTSPILSCGGSMFSIQRKWKAAIENKAKYLVVNATEGEPDTYKDWYLLNHYPELMVEAALSSALIIGAKEIFFCVNKSYLSASSLIDIWESRESCFASITLKVVFVDDLYVAGEETALLNFLEGKRAEPRTKPPLPVVSGYNNEPTLVSNIETLSWVMMFLNNRKVFDKGIPKLSTVSYRDNVEVVECLIGEKIVDIAKKVGADKFRFVEIGGVSGFFFKREQIEDVRWCNESLSKLGAFIGAGTIRFFDLHHDLEGEVIESLKFFEGQSCGQCTPCRVGTQRLTQLFDIESGDYNLKSLQRTVKTMRNTSFCGLGKSAPNPVCSYLSNIRGEIL